MSRFAVRPTRKVNVGILNTISGVFSWSFYYIVYIFLWTVCHFWYALGNSFFSVLYVVFWLLREFIRFCFYLMKLLRQIFLGFLRACWLSSLMMLIGVAVSSLVLVVPLLIAVFSLHEFAVTAAVVSDVVHQRDPSPFVVALHVFACALVFTFGISLGLWSTDPKGSGIVWWRDAMNQGLDLNLPAWCHFKMIRASLMNYSRWLAIRFLAAYVIALLGYDLLGKLVGGPYQIGFLFWTFLLLLLANFAISRVRGRDAWRIVRR